MLDSRFDGRVYNHALQGSGGRVERFDHDILVGEEGEQGGGGAVVDNGRSDVGGEGGVGGGGGAGCRCYGEGGGGGEGGNERAAYVACCLIRLSVGEFVDEMGRVYA